MSQRPLDKPSQAPRGVPTPVDVVDGIPDRSRHRPRWKYVALAAVFLAWVAVLLYCHLAGNV